MKKYHICLDNAEKSLIKIEKDITGFDEDTVDSPKKINRLKLFRKKAKQMQHLINALRLQYW